MPMTYEVIKMNDCGRDLHWATLRDRLMSLRGGFVGHNGLDNAVTQSLVSLVMGNTTQSDIHWATKAWQARNCKLLTYSWKRQYGDTGNTLSHIHIRLLVSYSLLFHVMLVLVNTTYPCGIMFWVLTWSLALLKKKTNPTTNVSHTSLALFGVFPHLDIIYDTNLF